MKVLFVFPSAGGGHGINEYTKQPPLGIAYIAAAIDRSGFAGEVLDANLLNYGCKDVASIIKKKRPDLLCLSLYAFNYDEGVKIAKAVKKDMPRVFVIAGGAHPSALGEKTQGVGDYIDAVVVGEGERTILEIARSIGAGTNPFADVGNVIYRRGSSIVKNRLMEPIGDLDMLPFPAFHLFPSLSSYHRRTMASPAAPILTSRGCPFECVFCSKSVFGRQVRYRSAENVMSEIDYLVERFKVRQLDIVDDNFITNKPRATAILESLLKKPYRLAINLQSGVSAILIDENMLKLMKRAGVYRIAFGVESGNQKVLERIKKRQRLDDIVRAVDLAKKAGIQTDAFFIIGLPGESPKAMQDTIDFAKKIDPHTANFHIAVPFPGTELYDIVKKEGRFFKTTDEGISSGYNYPDAFYELDGLRKDDVERYYKKAYREFYFRPSKLLKTVLNIQSVDELMWLAKTGMMIVSSMLNSKRADREGWDDEELDLLARLVRHPVFGLLYRHRYSMALSMVPRSDKILEIGCGHGFFLKSLSTKADKVYAMDMHPYMTKVRETTAKQVMLSRADAARLPYKDNSFNTIVCISMLEHMVDIDAVLSEMRRILVKGGVLVAGFPVKNILTRTLFKMIERDDNQIHPQSHSSIIAALKGRFKTRGTKVFPPFVPIDAGLYFVGGFVKDD